MCMHVGGQVPVLFLIFILEIFKISTDFLAFFSEKYVQKFN